MKLGEITTAMMHQAMQIYLAAAYESRHLPLGVKARVEFVTEHASDDLESVLSHELIERIRSEEDESVVESYAVRLGNEKYPHMKLALRRQKGDDYRLMVESHDRHFEVETSEPDAPKAQELQAYNRRLKAEIESRWREADLPVLDEA